MRSEQSIGNKLYLLSVLTLAVFSLPGCLIDAYFNNTASLGGDQPGFRSNIQVAFVNNTPYRAIFTYGTYDPLNVEQGHELSFPIFYDQFTADAAPERRLERNSSSDPITFLCGRALAVGDPRLVELIERNDFEVTSSGADIDLEALRPVVDPETGERRAGIAFSDRPLGDPGDDTSTAGWAPGLVTLQGAEYQCDSLVTYTFEVDPSQPGGIRTDVKVALP
jgi:hypothetical protein